MKKNSPFHSLIFILLFAMLACSTATPAVTPPQAVDLNTAIAQTAEAAMTQTALVLPPSQTFTPQATLTATNSPTLTLTATSLFTPTPEVAMITVSVSTNCRNGPGKVYDYEGALLVGDTTEVLGRDPSGEYWYARNPDSSGADYCWLWGKYATLTGNTSILPILTPPPTPTPTFTPVPTFTGTGVLSFVVVYSGLDTCKGNWWVDVKVENNGTINYKSLDMIVKDTNTNVTLEALADEFTDNDGCNKTTIKDVLGRGDTFIVSAPTFNYDPTGHLLRVTLILCPQTGQKGICAKQNFDIDL
jgi:hypothetical protein